MRARGNQQKLDELEARAMREFKREQAKQSAMRLHRLGCSRMQIARRLKVHPEKVTEWLQAEGIEPRACADADLWVE